LSFEKVKWWISLLALYCAGLCASCGDDSQTVTSPGPPRAPTSFVIEADGSGEFATIQDAINATIDGDTVELADGTYRGDGNRDIDFVGRKILVRSQSGDPDSCVIDVEGNATSLHRGFYFHSGEGAGSVLDGITIINGYHNRGGGGGVLCENASPRLVNLVLKNHEFGSGVLSRLSSPILERCLFTDNPGTGLSIWSSSPVVRDCVFLGNMEGAIGCFFSSATIEQCTFIENRNNTGGAIHVGAEADSGGFVSIRDCVFIGNHSSGDGGAVFFYDTPGEIINCTLVNNAADRSGGAMMATTSMVLEIAGTTFVGNRSPKASGLYIGSGANVRIHHSIIAFGQIGAAVECDTPVVGWDSAKVAVECSDVISNEGGDWANCLQGLDELDGNISDDPLFCSLIDGDLRLTPQSPCYQASCGVMGAFTAGCSGRFEELFSRSNSSAR